MFRQDAELQGDLHDVQSSSSAHFADQRWSAQLFLAILFRVRMASDLMSQHLRLILDLDEALCAVLGDGTVVEPVKHGATRKTREKNLHPKSCM